MQIATCGFLQTSKKVRQVTNVIFRAVLTVASASFDHIGLT